MSDGIVADEIANNESIGLIGGILWISYSVFLFFITLMNGKRVRSDLFTEERSSLSHRRGKPEITATYSLILLLTEGSILFYFIASIPMVLTYFTARSQSDCALYETLTAITCEVGKILLYLVFLARLDWLYSDSPFRFSVQKLIFCALIIVIYGFAIIIAMVSVWSLGETTVFFGYSDSGQFPNYCGATLDWITGAMVAIQDCVYGAAFLYSFYKPLKLTTENEDKLNAKVAFKIRYSGTKTFILTFVASAATILLVLITIITDLNFIVGLDAVFHPVCLILMTPHYHDKLWYHRCCCLCLKCCGQTQPSLDVDNKDKDQELLSVDTLDQLKIHLQTVNGH